MTPKVLVVDDMRDTADALVRTLKKVGCAPVAVYSEKKALEYLNQFETLGQDVFDVVVTDMRMEKPNSGLEVLKSAKKIIPSVKVIILTAYGEVGEAVSAVRDFGAFHYVEKKPEDFQGQDVYDRVADIVEKAMVQIKRFKENTKKKTVLELDMVGYSDVARVLEEILDSQAVSGLEQSIKAAIDQVLEEIGLGSKNTVLTTEGDSAILAFDSPEQAHQFAETFHLVAKKRNQTKTEPYAMRVFRIGVATGEIYLHSLEGGGFDFSGITITDAVRLEQKARPGELLIDGDTFSELPSQLKHRYQREEKIQGKRDEIYGAYRYIIDSGAPTLAARFEESK